MNVFRLKPLSQRPRACPILAIALVLGLGSMRAFAQVEIATIPRSHATGGSSGPITSIGDVDADGIADVVSQIFDAQDIAPWLSAVDVRSGRTGAILWTVGRMTSLESFGDVASSADVNGDGVRDVLVGVPGPGKQSGQVIPGYAVALSGLDGTLLITVSGVTVDERFGSSVAGIGDVNGDGKDDFVVGAPFEQPTPGVWAGVVHVYSGANGSQLYALSGSGSSRFGYAVASVGDCNGDAVPDFAVGSPFESSGPVGEHGAVRVFSGSNGTPLWSFPGTVFQDHVGLIVFGVGDVNADGRGDLVTNSVGAASPPGNPTPLLVRSGIDGSALIQIDGTQVSAVWGDVVAAGDADKDGYGDVAVGDSTGSLRVFSGRTGAQLWSVNSNGSIGFVGNYLVNAGDLNGDGVSDLAVSADPNPFGGDAVRGFTITCGKTETIGASCSASHGGLPSLTVIGAPCLTPRATGVTLRIDLTINPSAPPIGFVFVSPNEIALPLGGGCTLFAASPLVGPIVVPMFTGLYSVALGPVPFGAPLTSFVAQAFRPDPALPLGYYATNGVRLTID